MNSYDEIAGVYLANRNKLKSGKYVQQLLKYLPKNSRVLDLGCGAGVPVDNLLLKAGHRVIGMDISSEQIELAKNNCCEGEYLVGDIQDLRESEYRVDGVVSFYSIFHVPRTKQSELLKKVASFLPKGGMLLITMGDREFEGEHMLYGEKMWSSQYGTVKNHKIVESAGFKIIIDEMDNSGGERHQIILAQKL